MDHTGNGDKTRYCAECGGPIPDEVRCGDDLCAPCYADDAVDRAREALEAAGLEVVAVEEQVAERRAEFADEVAELAKEYAADLRRMEVILKGRRRGAEKARERFVRLQEAARAAREETPPPVSGGAPISAEAREFWMDYDRWASALEAECRKDDPEVMWGYE